MTNLSKIMAIIFACALPPSIAFAQSEPMGDSGQSMSRGDGMNSGRSASMMKKKKSMSMKKKAWDDEKP